MGQQGAGRIPQQGGNRGDEMSAGSQGGAQGPRAPSAPGSTQSGQQGSSGQGFGSASAGGIRPGAAPGQGGSVDGHPVDPGGSPTQAAQFAPNARPGILLPGTVTGGRPTGMNLGAGGDSSNVSNGRGNGALAGSLDENPERFMAEQRVPPSLRAYVRQYFQGLAQEGGGEPQR
jgi:hypothetical protein